MNSARRDLEVKLLDNCHLILTTLSHYCIIKLSIYPKEMEKNRILDVCGEGAHIQNVTSSMLLG